MGPLRVVLRPTERTNQVAGEIAGRGSFKFKTTLMMTICVVVLLAHVIERIAKSDKLST